MHQTEIPRRVAKILTLGKNPQALAQISSILENEGHNVPSFGSVSDLIRYLHNQPVIDLIAADLDGWNDEHYERLKILCCSDRFKKFPIIACGQLGDRETIQKASTLGIVSYILKPIKAECLVAKVNEVLEADPGCVLVVDNQQLLLDILRRTIEWAGYKVVTVNSGSKALDIMDSRKVALVISDIEMPEMTGLSLIPEMRKRSINAPVILLTGHGDRYNEDGLKEAGAAGLVTKPFNNRQLVHVVHTTYAKARIARLRRSRDQEARKHQPSPLPN